MCPYTFWTEFSKFLLPFVIGGATIYIAWQQWKTNKQKLSFDLYDRRLHVYNEVRKILSLAMSSSSPGHDAILNFYRTTSEASFLFGSDVTDFLDDTYNHLLKLQEWSDAYRDFNQHIPSDYDGKTISRGIHDESVWLTHQITPAKEIFKKYLNLDDSSCYVKLRRNVRRSLRQLREFLTARRAQWFAARKK